MSRARSRRLALVGLVALLVFPAAARPAEEARVKVDATLTPDPVGLDEVALLTMTVDAEGLRLPELEPVFDLRNLEPLGAPSTSRSHSWVNGVTTSRLERTWRLRPLAAGTAAEVRALRFEMHGQTRVVGDLSVSVVESAPTRRRVGQHRSTPLDPFGGLFGEGGDDPFAPFRRRTGPGAGSRAVPGAEPIVRLASETAPAAVFVGQQSVWRLAIETQTDVTSFDLRELPDFAGLWSRPLELPSRPVRQDLEIGGLPGARFEVLARALFPLREGTLRIGPAIAQVSVRTASAGLLGLVTRDRPKELRSAPATIVVRPLPAGAPEGFSGLVGRLAVDSELEPARVEAGAAATLRIRISGDANFEGARPPELRLPPGLRLFPPQRELEEQRAGERLESHLTWSWVLVGERPGRYAVPPIRVASFDPHAVEYRTAEAEVPALEVVAATGDVGATPDPAGAPTSADAAPGLARRLAWPTPRTALRAGVLVAFLAALGLAVARLRERPSSPAGRLRHRLEEARAADTPREAAKALEETWRAHLVDRFAIGADVPAARWPALLAERGVPAATADEMAALLEDLHLLAFAPELADAEALRADLVRRSRRLVRRLS